MTQTAPTETPQPADRRLVSVAFPATTGNGPVAGVALVTIERPDVLNALSFDLLDELAAALAALDADPACRAIVLTGSGTRAFAAGADIRELAVQTPVSLLVGDRFAVWERIAATRTPVIAAVRGFALGGGCELALSCDLIVAGDDAQFGQPEINLGVMPGAGGTINSNSFPQVNGFQTQFIDNNSLPAFDFNNNAYYVEVYLTEACSGAAGNARIGLLRLNRF